jgi:hypothetical protein
MASSTLKGGKKLEAHLAKLSQQIDKAAKVKVGFLSGATYSDGTPVAMVAAIQNFGAPARGIPPRPFFSNMVADKSHEWGPAIGTLLRDNGMNSEVALEQLGQGIAGQLRESIVNTNEPPLSPVTLMLRKMRTENPNLVVTAATVGQAARLVAAGEPYGGVSTKPLVDIGPEGGHMLQSVDYQVTSGD